MPSPYNRRDFLSTFLKGAGGFTVVASLPFAGGCGPQPRPLPGRYHFPQGLASGDPTPRSVVLWSRVEALDGAADPVEVVLQVALSEDFGRLVVDQTLTTEASRDHTLRVRVTGLEPDTLYNYRFLAGGDATPLVGRTRTAPEAGADDPVRVAVAESESWEQGDFGAWRTLVQEDLEVPQEDRIHVVLHLGSFVHGVLGAGGIRGADPLPVEGEEVMEEGPRALSLEDVRHVYRTALSAPDLQAARARWPFIVAWNAAGFTEAARRAWLEYIPALLPELPDDPPTGDAEQDGMGPDPARLASMDTLRMHRSFRFGRHLELVVPDAPAGRSREGGVEPAPPPSPATWVVVATPAMRESDPREEGELLRSVAMEPAGTFILLGEGPRHGARLLTPEEEGPGSVPPGVAFQLAGIGPVISPGAGEPAVQGVARLMARSDRVEVEMLETDAGGSRRIRFTVRRGSAQGRAGGGPVLEGPTVPG